MRIYTIMVVDDEEETLDLFSQAFALHGYNVLAARNAEEALVMLHDISCSVFFVDLAMPGLNGIELCKYIRRQLPMAITFAVAGHDSLFELTDCRDAGFEDYFTKPVPLSELIAAAKSACLKLERWRCQPPPARPEAGDFWSLKMSPIATGNNPLPQ